MKSPLLTSLLSISAFIFLFEIATPAIAQGLTEEEIEKTCGKRLQVESAGSISAFRSADKKVEQENAKIDACIARLRNTESINAIPVGGRYPNASINGIPLQKCSHGGACQGQLLREMQKGNY